MKDNSDEISSIIGPGAQNVAAGKEINQQITTVVGGMDTIINLLVSMREELSTMHGRLGVVCGEVSLIKEDVRQAHVERANMIGTVNGLADRVNTIRDEIYPQWLKWVMASLLGIAIIVPFLIWGSASSVSNISWMAFGIYFCLIGLAFADIVIIFLFFQLRSTFRDNLRGTVDDLVDDRIHRTVTELEKRIENAKYQNTRAGDGVDGS